jgi:two-component system OmpR family sensor kinase
LFSQQRSLRFNFLIKLAAATVILELLFSYVFYTYISYSVDRELKHAMVKQAKYLFSTYDDVSEALTERKEVLQKTLNLQVRIDTLPQSDFRSIYFKTFKRDDHYFLEGYFPYEFALQRYLVLTADITQQKRVENQVVRGIILISLFGMVGVILYAFFLSGMLVAPVRIFSQKLAALNARALAPLDLKDVPEEFVPLGRSINQLIARIESFLRYKKELFVGTAHELKTPLAVIKTKSQVVLMKRKRTQADLEDALRQTIRSVDDMNRIVGSILEFGRAEGAQFEAAERIDAMVFLEQMCSEFSLLAEHEDKRLDCRLLAKGLTLTVPKLLLRQIVQNLLQNALRFTPKKGRVALSAYQKDDHLVVLIRDEGPGIEEGVDLFAPFQRSENSEGVGLGLFLVRSAADALNAEVTLKNRIDGRGAIASLKLPLDGHTLNKA